MAGKNSKKHTAIKTQQWLKCLQLPCAVEMVFAIRHGPTICYGNTGWPQPSSVCVSCCSAATWSSPQKCLPVLQPGPPPSWNHHSRKIRWGTPWAAFTTGVLGFQICLEPVTTSQLQCPVLWWLNHSVLHRPGLFSTPYLPLTPDFIVL